MDGYEATRIVFSRIQNLDPENGSKIMGLLLLQDHGEKEMIRLAFGPEALVHSVTLKARKELGLSSNSPINSPLTPSSPSPFLARQNSSSSRLLGSNNNLSSAVTDLPNPDGLIPQNSTTMNSLTLPFYGNGNGSSDIMIDGFEVHDELFFLNGSSPNLGNKNQDIFFPSQMDILSSSPPNGTTDSMLFPSYWGGASSVYRRSSSVSDVLGSSSDDLNSEFGWSPCLYFARGYCKNGSSCRFFHGLVGSPTKIESIDQCHELLRFKSAAAQVQHQRLAAASHLLDSSSFPDFPKSMNLSVQQQQNDTQRAAGAAAMMQNEDIHKFGRSRLERNDFSMNGDAGILNPASRQIYLTFPADSTFREEDVSNYFSIYGPVQDVRIPYQQKRMFGFVTFLYPETVKIILAKGNPHFVCDARVLVKPYKEKGKVPDKYRKQQQQVERGEFSPCGTPTGVDSKDPFDNQVGVKMFYNNTQDLLWRRKMEEQADLQQALELQSRRLMGIQLLDVKKHHHHRALSTGSPIHSPTHSPNIFQQNHVFPPLHSSNTESLQENGSGPLSNISVSASADNHAANGKDSISWEEIMNGNGNESTREGNKDVLESLVHNLPDSPFASPTKGNGEYFSTFSNDASGNEEDSANDNLVSANLSTVNASIDMESFKSFNCQMPGFSSEHGAIGMYTGTSGPTCPVGN